MYYFLYDYLYNVTVKEFWLFTTLQDITLKVLLQHLSLLWPQLFSGLLFFLSFLAILL